MTNACRPADTPRYTPAVTASRVLADLRTPALVLDAEIMHRNTAAMRSRLDELDVPLRAHVKTGKSLPVVCAMTGEDVGGDQHASPLTGQSGAPGVGGASDHRARSRAPITVSTLREAEYFAAHGYRDILYAVGITPDKLRDVAALRATGCDVSVILDSEDAARHVAEFGRTAGADSGATAQARAQRIAVLIEVDCDGHRAGVREDDPRLLRIAETLAHHGILRGIMTHAGGSYACRTREAIADMAERERAAAVGAADRLRKAGFPVHTVSVGSTPTATFARHLSGVTEVRAGVYVFQDLVIAGLGVCAINDIAISVLVTVIGHQPDKGWLITDGGWMALSRDLGTAGHEQNQHYGLVCDIEGTPIDAPGDLLVTHTNQEHGVITHRNGKPIDRARFPIGTRLRILPIHACATASQHDRYQVVRGTQTILHTWPRFGGW